MQLIGFATDAVGEQQDIALLPRNVLGREFVTRSGCRHFREHSYNLNNAVLSKKNSLKDAIPNVLYSALY